MRIQWYFTKWWWLNKIRDIKNIPHNINARRKADEYVKANKERIEMILKERRENADRLFQKYVEARRLKDYIVSDRIRDELKSTGFRVNNQGENSYLIDSRQ